MYRSTSIALQSIARSEKKKKERKNSEIDQFKYPKRSHVHDNNNQIRKSETEATFRQLLPNYNY